MNNPRISIVMPVFNVETYVAEAISSVLKQTFSDFELIIVDDGGTDQSIPICLAFDDPRIRVIHQRNRGLAGARNTGIAAARGEYIALLDSDDRWHADKLMLHAIHLDNTADVGVSFCGSNFIDARGNKLRQAQRPKLHEVTAEDILTRNPVGNGSAAVIRRRALDEVAFLHPEERGRVCWFDESFRQSEDIELWVRMALTSGFRFDGIEPLMTDYRIIGGGLSANVLRQYESWDRMLAKTTRYAPEFVAEHGATARAFQLRYLARRSIQMGDAKFALLLLKDAAKTSLRPFWAEPGKTLETWAAALLARAISPAALSRLAARWTGAGVVA
jgi:glycosyltransferase involved in cell wall biosynthesis